jgi:hypothetical protein
MDRAKRIVLFALVAAVLGAAGSAGQQLAAPDDCVWQSSPLRTVEPNRERSEQIEGIARQADERTRHGFELAGRGAYFAARAEFIAALRMVAEGLDTEQKTNIHGKALAMALIAMKEAEDFLPRGSRLEADLDVAAIIAIHTTPVLKSFVVVPSGGRSDVAPSSDPFAVPPSGGEDDHAQPAKAGTTNTLTPMTALKCYFTFAQEQLSVAAGHEVAGSMSLYALGKLHDSLAQKQSDREPAAGSKAMVFYQAALLVDPANVMAANDLGVLLARAGDYRHARLMLEHSVSIHPYSATWHSLAVVYRQLGEPALADRANGQSALAGQVEMAERQRRTGTSKEGIQWLDPETFAQTSTSMPNAPGPSAAPPTQSTVAGRGVARKIVRPSPAPTPAAAQREAWGAAPSQR